MKQQKCTYSLIFSGDKIRHTLQTDRSAEPSNLCPNPQTPPCGATFHFAKCPDPAQNFVSRTNGFHLPHFYHFILPDSPQFPPSNSKPLLLQDFRRHESLYHLTMSLCTVLNTTERLKELACQAPSQLGDKEEVVSNNERMLSKYPWSTKLKPLVYECNKTTVCTKKPPQLQS